VCSRCQREMTTAEASDNTALSANTHSLPALAINAPAANGPKMREAFMETPFRPRAAGSCAVDTISGTMAANTGQRMARPMPLANTKASRSAGDITPMNTATLSTLATTATQIWVNK
jgi:hypothetical protein